MVFDVNVTKLLYDCLDSLRVSRDDADALLKELNAELADVISGTKSRFEVVDTIVKKWLLKSGGDPSHYKKHTKAFDALATLADRLIRQHVETMEGATDEAHKMMESLEGALRGVAGSMREPLRNRLGPALAALIATTSYEEMLRAGARLGLVKSATAGHEEASTEDTDKIMIQYVENEETMTALIKSLVNLEFPLSAQSIDNIDITHVMDDIRDCGVPGSQQVLEYVVKKTIKYLRAQLLTPAEKEKLQQEVDEVLGVYTAPDTSQPRRRTTHFDTMPTYKESTVEKPPDLSPPDSAADDHSPDDHSPDDHSPDDHSPDDPTPDDPTPDDPTPDDPTPDDPTPDDPLPDDPSPNNL